MATNNLLSAIRGLEDAVYYRDSRGRYASLPDNNSMRIDLLSGRVDKLAELIDESTGGDIPGQIQQIVQYLDGTAEASDFPSTKTGNNIIEPKEGDTHDYSNVQKVLQYLYNLDGGGQTGITIDNAKDPYMNDMIRQLTPAEKQ